MGIISTQNKFLFIHIPKTGGTSIKNLLQPNGERLTSVNGLLEYCVKHYPDYYFDKGGIAHAPATHLRAFYGNAAWDALFKFAIIRNPWDRMVSAYTYMQQTPNNKRYAIMQHMEFSDFVRLFCKTLPRGISHLFTDDKGNVILDEIYRLEDIHTHNRSIQLRCGLKEISPLPHQNKSNRQDYRSYYSDLDAERVQKACQLEISTGNYRF